MPRTELFILAHDPEAARHVGATAIPGCLTKGDLDIVVRVDPSHFTADEGRLAASFDRNVGSIRTDHFAAFEDEEAHPHLRLQLTVKGGCLRRLSSFRRSPARRS